MIKSLGKIFAKLMAAHVELHASEVCAECGSQLARDADGRGERPREALGESKDGSSVASPHQTEVWHCPNPDCPPQVLKRVVLWASPEAMDIQGCDDALVGQLVQRGLVLDAAEFYQLSLAEIVALDGMGEGKARGLGDAIKASKQREAWRVLFGLGIPQISAADAQVLCRQFESLPQLFTAGRERLLTGEGVSEVAARQLRRWLGDPVNRKLVKRLEKAGVNFKTEL